MKIILSIDGFSGEDIPSKIIIEWLEKGIKNRIAASPLRFVAKMEVVIKDTQNAK